MQVTLKNRLKKRETVIFLLKCIYLKTDIATTDLDIYKY